MPQDGVRCGNRVFRDGVLRWSVAEYTSVPAERLTLDLGVFWDQYRCRVVFLFLDIDGNLLPFGAPEIAPTPISIVAGSPLLGRLDPDHGPRLAALPCELVWATTWMEEANAVMSPLLRLPDLPVLDWPEPSAEDVYFNLHPKTRSVVAWAGGQDFAWVDDEITESDREWVGDHHRGRALLLQVNPHRGLTASNITALEDWLLGRSKQSN